jgi:16S rRNA C1402 (ribose-2'-O) methylase RsmI
LVTKGGRRSKDRRPFFMLVKSHKNHDDQRMPEKPSRLTQLLDDILRILKRDGKGVIDLARELGLGSSSHPGDSGYNQLYNWLVVRLYKPKGEIVLRLAEWRDKQKKHHGRKIKSDKAKKNQKS